MAAATDYLEQIYYRLVFEAGFGDSVIDTTNLKVVLYNTIPNDAQDNAFLELVDPLTTGINEILAPGYAAVDVDDGTTNGPNFELAGSGDTGLWVNINNLIFGTATSTWTVRGWGIKDIVSSKILMTGNFVDDLGAPLPAITVPATEDFVIPAGAFKVTID